MCVYIKVGTTFLPTHWTWRFPGGSRVKKPTNKQNTTCQCRRCKRHWFDHWVGKIPWRRKWQPTPVFSPGESHGQRSLAGYSPRGRGESDTTEPAFTSSALTCLPGEVGVPGRAGLHEGEVSGAAKLRHLHSRHLRPRGRQPGASVHHLDLLQPQH